MSAHILSLKKTDFQEGFGLWQQLLAIPDIELDALLLQSAIETGEVFRNHLNTVIPEDHDFEAEYGTEVDAPNPLYRNAVAATRPQLSNHFSQSILEKLLEVR